MAKINVKPEHADKVIGYNNSAAPLGKRNDYHVLLEAAKAHNYKHILDLFEEVPDDAEILHQKGKAFLERQARKRRAHKAKHPTENKPEQKSAQ